jgi:hypothetical protein
MGKGDSQFAAVGLAGQEIAGEYRRAAADAFVALRHQAWGASSQSCGLGVCHGDGELLISRSSDSSKAQWSLGAQRSATSRSSPSRSRGVEGEAASLPC